MSRREELRKAKRAARQAEKKERRQEARQRAMEKSKAIREAENERHIVKEAKRTGQSVEAVRERYKNLPLWGVPAPDDTE